MHPLKLALLAPACLLMTGCVITKSVDPIPATQVSTVCVLENPKVLMDGFQPEMQRQIEAKNIPTRSYTGARPPECSHHLEYTATWAWDIAMYLTYAEFRVYDPAGVAGSAAYDARWGGGRLDKFGRTADKIRPLLDDLFSLVSVDADRIAAPVESERSAAVSDEGVPVEESSGLHDDAVPVDSQSSTGKPGIPGGT